MGKKLNNLKSLSNILMFPLKLSPLKLSFVLTCDLLKANGIINIFLKASNYEIATHRKYYSTF